MTRRTRAAITAVLAVGLTVPAAPAAFAVNGTRGPFADEYSCRSERGEFDRYYNVSQCYSKGDPALWFNYWS